MIDTWFGPVSLSIVSTCGLLAFVGMFVGVCVWALTRTRRDVSRWSELPLEDSRVDR